MKNSFEKGITAYQKGDFEAALGNFLEVEKFGTHWKNLYNIGNTHYKLENFTQAKIYYLKALKLNPSKKMIRSNIKMVNKKFKDEIIDDEPEFIQLIFMKIESVLSTNILSILVIILVLSVNLFIFLLIRKKKMKLMIYGVSFTMLFLILVSGYLIFRVNKLNNQNLAVVKVSEANLRSGPAERNTVLYKVHSGLKMRILKINQTWLLVSAESDVSGWIKKESIEII